MYHFGTWASEEMTGFPPQEGSDTTTVKLFVSILDVSFISPNLEIPKSIAIWPRVAESGKVCGSGPPAGHGLPSLYCYIHCRCCRPCSGHNCRDIFGLLGVQERCTGGGTITSPCRSDGDTTEDCICGTSSSSWPELLSFISCVPTNTSACVPTSSSTCMPTSSSACVPAIPSASLHSNLTCSTTFHTGPAESCLCPADFAKWSNLFPDYRSWSHSASVSRIPSG